MSFLSDILSALDRYDLWKRMKATPDRLDALEKRVAALEALLAGRPGRTCRFCGTGLVRLADIKPHRTFGVLGVKVEIWTCEACGRSEEREQKP